MFNTKSPFHFALLLFPRFFLRAREKSGIRRSEGLSASGVFIVQDFHIQHWFVIYEKIQNEISDILFRLLIS